MFLNFFCIELLPVACCPLFVLLLLHLHMNLCHLCICELNLCPRRHKQGKQNDSAIITIKMEAREPLLCLAYYQRQEANIWRLKIRTQQQGPLRNFSLIPVVIRTTASFFKHSQQVSQEVSQQGSKRGEANVILNII